MLRTSNYAVLIELPSDPERFLLHHGIRGGYEIVPRGEAGYLMSQRRGSPSAPLYGEWTSEPALREGTAPIAPARVETLIKRGYLTAWSPDEEEAWALLTIRRIHQKSLAAALGYDFLLAYHQAPGVLSRATGLEPAAPSFTPQLIDLICDSLLAFEELQDVNLGGDSPRRIGIVGTASLAGRNRSLVEHLIERVQRLGTARIWAETTGPEVEEYAGLIGPRGIETISLICNSVLEGNGIDSRSALRGLQRRIEWLLGTGATVLLKLHSTLAALKVLGDVAALVVANGWAEDPRFSVRLVPPNAEAVRPGREAMRLGSALPLEPWQFDELLTRMAYDDPALARLNLVQPIGAPRMSHILDTELDVVSRHISRHGFHTYVLDPCGNIYTSPLEAGDLRLRIGEVTRAAGIRLHRNTRRGPSLARRMLGAAKACRKCPYGLHCGWGAEVGGGEGPPENMNGCDAFAHRFRSAMAEICAAPVAG